jgi:hypothetical protein
VRGVLEAVTDAELGQIRRGVLIPGEDEESPSVGHCLRVVLREHCEHRRYAVRDLAVLEARAASTA